MLPLTWGIQSEQWRRIVFVAQSVNPGNEPRNPLLISSYCSIRYFLGVPVKARYGLAKRPPRRGRWRPSHSVKRPDCLRRLAPQPRFVAAHAVKQGRVKIGKAQETLGDGAGIRPEWWANEPRQQFLVGGVRGGGFAIAINLSGGWKHAQLTGSVGWGLPGCQRKFALHLKQARFDRAGTTKSPQQAGQPVSEGKFER